MSQLSFISFIFLGYTFLICGISCKSKLFREFVIFLFIFFFASIAATRFDTVPDTKEYIKHYIDVAKLPFNDFGLYYFEPGYVLLAKLNYRIFREYYRIFFLFLTILNCLLVSVSIKNFYCDERETSKYVVLSLIYYISFYGLYFNFIVLRFGLAGSFFLLSLANFKKKNIKSVIFYSMSILCHMSFLIILPFYICVFLQKKIHSKAFYYIWLLVVGIIYYFRMGRLFTSSILAIIVHFGEKIFGNYAYYLNNLDLGNSKIAMRFTLNYLMGFIFVRYGNIKDRYYAVILFFYFIGLSIYSLFSMIELIDRVSDILLLSGIFLVPIYYKALKTVQDKFILYFPICIMNMLFAIRIINR